MSEEQQLTFNSLEQFYNGVQNFKATPLTKYNLEIECPITNEAFMKLSSSVLGDVISQLTISFDPDELSENSDKFVVDTSKGHFSALKKLSFVCQPLQSIYFSKTGYPLLEELTVEQPGNHPNSIILDLPTLRLLHFEHIYINDGRGFGKSLSRCPMLGAYCSYKLWGLGCLQEHTIVAPHLETFEIQRSDDLRGLRFWAPRLSSIRLKSCYALEVVSVLEEIPGGNWGQEYTFSGQPSMFDVSYFGLDLFNCRGNVLTSKRTREISDDLDDFMIY